MKRALIVLAAIGLTAPAAFAQVTITNDLTRKATAERILMGEKACKACDLFQQDFSYKDLPGRDLSESRLRQANLSLSTFDKSKFAGANMSVLNGFGARFDDSDFTGVDFQDSTLVGAWFGGANLTGVEFTNANLSGAYFVTAKGLTQAQLDKACGDASTELPKGLKISMCAPASPGPAPQAPEPSTSPPAPQPPQADGPRDTSIPAMPPSQLSPQTIAALSPAEPEEELLGSTKH
jgi:hypothetical protein